MDLYCRVSGFILFSSWPYGSDRKLQYKFYGCTYGWWIISAHNVWIYRLSLGTG